jgi:hypothetical protein
MSDQDLVQRYRRLLVNETILVCIYGESPHNQELMLERLLAAKKGDTGGRRRARPGLHTRRTTNGGAGTMPWKKLELPKKPAEQPTIRVATNGRITWSPAVQADIDELKAVEVLYDAERGLLGIRFIEAGGIPVPAGMRSIGAKKLLEAEGLMTSLQLPITPRVAERDAEYVWAISIR